MSSSLFPGESLCPSAQPSMRNPSILGVVDADSAEPRIAYLSDRMEFSEGIASLEDQVPLGKVLRLSAICEEQQCSHFDGEKCRLAERLVNLLPIVVEQLPACNIRSDCRWFMQEGREACMRCPQVVTLSESGDENLVLAALGPPPLSSSA